MGIHLEQRVRPQVVSRETARLAPLFTQVNQPLRLRMTALPMTPD